MLSNVNSMQPRVSARAMQYHVMVGLLLTDGDARTCGRLQEL